MQLVAENLVLSRGGRIIVAGLSFRVETGQALVLTGPNGSGKTTLLRALAGFLAPAAGRVLLEGAPDEREPGECAHFVGHQDGTKTHLTVAENLDFWSKFLGNDHTEANVGLALERFALEPLCDIPAGYLSAGQRRRLALARALVAPRPIWLLDEPTVSLDSASVELLNEGLKAHLADGGLAVIATHVALALDDIKEVRLGAAEGAE